MTTVGDENVIAFYRPVEGNCNIYVVTCNRNDDSGAQQVRFSLSPRQVVHIDAPQNESLNLQCGDKAETLSIVGTAE
jgi:hypothetical protein